MLMADPGVGQDQADMSRETDRMDEIHIDAESMLHDDNVMLTISCPHVLFNVHATPKEWKALRTVRQARADDRTDVRLGSCLGQPVWWSAADQTLNISVGPDVESCDVGLALPLTSLDEMLHATTEASKDEWH